MSPIESRNGPTLALTPRQRVKEKTAAQVDYLSGEVEQPLLRQAIDFANAIPNLREGLKNDPPAESFMEQVLAGLLDPRPAFGEPPTEAMNRYLNWRVVKNNKDEDVYIYTIDPPVVKNDLDELTRLQGIHSALARDIERVKVSLNEYARRDERMVNQDLGELRRNLFASKVASQVGNTAGVAILGFAATLAGGLMIAKMISEKSISKGLANVIPVLLFGAGAYWFYKSGSRQASGVSIFSAKEEKDLAPLDKIFNRSSFTAIARRYRMEGPAWANAVDQTMQPDPTWEELSQKLKDKTAQPRDIDDFAKSVSREPSVRNAIIQMIQNGDYERFRSIVSGAKEPNAQSVVVDYVKTGAWKFAKQ